MEYIVEILRENDEGLGIAKISDVTVFVSNALEGEKVKIRITEKHKNYWKAETLEILEKSSNRVDADCKYYSVCGGCNIMHMSYKKQLEFKLNRVKHIFKKIYNKDVIIDGIEYGSPFNYRNKVVLRVENETLGFYKYNTNDLFNCNKCIISSDMINKTIEVISKFIINNKNHNIKEIMIRKNNDYSNKIMVCIDNINHDLKQKFIDELSKYDFIVSIYISEILEYGNHTLTINMFDLNFEVSPKSFFQVNEIMAKKLYQYVLDNIDQSSNALDLYCGTGTITSIISKKCKKVIGIEVIEDAVKNANKNIKNNNINNIEFICSKVENVIDKIDINNIDLVIMDPPRSGSDKKTLKTICRILPKKIIYISCNPITLVRDLKQLDKYYDIKNIKLFDMFPNTHHVECVSVLHRKKL